jgi:hypothetical protein
MECWKDGFKNFPVIMILAFFIIPFFHHSIFPGLQFRNPAARRPGEP